MVGIGITIIILNIAIVALLVLVILALSSFEKLLKEKPKISHKQVTTSQRLVDNQEKEDNVPPNYTSVYDLKDAILDGKIDIDAALEGKTDGIK